MGHEICGIISRIRIFLLITGVNGTLQLISQFTLDVSGIVQKVDVQSIGMRPDLSVIVIKIEVKRITDLLQTVLTLRSLRPLSGFLQSRHQHRRQDRNNGNNHEKFDESKCFLKILHNLIPSYLNSKSAISM